MTTLTLMTPVTLCFPTLVTPFASTKFTNTDGSPKTPTYNCTFRMLKEHPEVARIVAAMQATAKERWGDDLPTPFSWALQDGDVAHKIALQDGGRGKAWAQGFWIMPVKSYNPPRLSATLPDGSFVDFTDENRAEARQYLKGGVDVLAEVNFVGYPKKGVKAGPMGYSVTAYVNIVAATGTGVPDPKLDTMEQRPGSSILAARGHVGTVSNVVPATSGLPI